MHPLRQPIAITGLGAICNLGRSLDTILAAVRAGQPGPMVEEPLAVELGARCTLVARVSGTLDDAELGVDRKVGRFLGRASRLALWASQRALDDSGVDPGRVGIVFGSGAGDVDTHRDVQARLDRTGSMRRIPPTVIPRVMSSTVSANLTNALSARGPSMTAAAACAGGAWNAIAACQLLDSGHADAVLCGGVECWDPHFHAGFDSMRAYNPGARSDGSRASRPYAADRAGFVMGEGAGAFVLERLSDAQARGATVHGLLLGFGVSSDGAGDMVAPDPSGAERAIRQALEHAGLGPGAVDYVNTHATSTPAGDVSEVTALRRVFGERRVPYSSTKALTGHTISGAGALEAVFTTAMVRDGWIAPAANSTPLDPALADWPPTSGGDAELRVALSNAFGFGGTNAVLVIGRA